MQINKKKVWVWGSFVLYLFVVTQIILVKHPRYFLLRMIETFYHRQFQWIGLYANFKPFRTIRHMLFVRPDFTTALVNIGGNILLFIPMGMFLPMYFNAPYKTLKTIATCFLFSAFFEIFQLITVCGYFDVDDMILNTLGGAIGMFIYSLFINHSSFTSKKLVATYAPN